MRRKAGQQRGTRRRTLRSVAKCVAKLDATISQGIMCRARYGAWQERRLLVGHKEEHVRRSLRSSQQRSGGDRCKNLAAALIHPDFSIELDIISFVKFLLIALLAASPAIGQTSLGT